MKKYFLYFTAVVTMISMIFTTSCQRVENPSAIGVESEVTFSVSTPDIQTRAYSDGTTAKELTVAVYNGESLLFTEGAKMQGTQANVTLTLVNGMNYNIVFWAQAAGAPYHFDTDKRTMTVDYNGVHANDENLDAFWKKIEYKSEGAKTQKVELTRPFAQLNIAANDWEEAIRAGVEVTKSNVKVENVYSEMNMFTGAVAEGSEVAVEFGMNTTPNSAGEELSGYEIAKGYHWLAMNYLLVNKQELVVVTFNTNSDNVSEKVYRDIPVKRNYRTNIYGKILTSDTEFDVETKPGFDGDEDIYVYEGVTYVPVADADAANEAFDADAKAVAIKGITDDANIVLPSLSGEVYLVLPNTDSEVNIKYSTSGVDKPAKLYVTIPEGKVSTLNIDATESTVYLNGDVTTLTAGTASNTLYIVGGQVETLNVAQGNVVIENYAGVNNISRTTNNTDPVTKVFASETASLPEKEGDNTDLIILGYPDFEETEEGSGIYEIHTLKGLKEFRDAVNEGNMFSGKQITLKADVDLKDLNWTSIGTEANPFSGTFEGDGKTIKNLTIIENEAKEGKAYIGFFGYAKNATVKNVVFENVNINIPCLDIDHSQGHIGAVAGSLEGTSTIENVTVKGDVMVYSTESANGASRVAVVAGGNSYGNVTMKNVHVVANEGSYLIANNNVGALAGQLQGKSVFENCSSNIDVTGTKFFAGGIIGLAAGDQLFTNCHTTGDITITAGREGRAHDQYRVGGIAGGWADGAKNVCTLNGCTFKGVVSGKNSDGSVANPLDYAGYVGRGYTLNGCQGSKVIIDGVEYVQAFNTAAEAGIYYIDDILTINSATAFKLFADMVSSGTDFAGQTIKLGADIDLNNEEWTPIKVDGYHGAGIVTIEGNGKTITNLSAPLFAGGFAGRSGIVIKNLTIANSNIVSSNTIGSGAFIESVDSMEKIWLENCHVKKTSITGGAGSRTGGLIGWTAGYNNVNDGPVKTYVTIKGCSVIECNITCDGSVGGLYGHAGNNAWTYSTVENCTVQNCTLASTDDGEWRVGVAVGTANVGELTITNLTESGNVLTQTGKEAPTGEKRNYYGRFVPGTTGVLVIDGNAIVGGKDGLAAAIEKGATTINLLKGEYIIPSVAQGKTLTFVGLEDNPEAVKVGVTKVGTGGENCDYGLDGSTVTFENITITTNSSTYIGYARCKGTYKNCVINGTYTLYDNSIFENCTFNVSGDVYNIWTWGAPTATFNECTFNSDGKAMLLYGTADTKLTVNNCTFNDKGGLTDKKAAIEIGNDYNKSYELIVNNTTVNGYEINDKGINTGTTLWANKNSMSKDKLNVVVDGVDVY